MVVEGFEVWHFLKDFLFPICFDAQVVPFGKINSNHWVECHESADDTQLYHLPLCSEFFPCPAVMLGRDLQMDKSELPCPQPWENRMLAELLIWELSWVCAHVQRDVCGGTGRVLASFWKVSLFWKGYCQALRRMIWLFKWTAFVGYDFFKFHFDLGITRVALLPRRLYYCNSQGRSCSRAFLWCAQNSKLQTHPFK